MKPESLVLAGLLALVPLPAARAATVTLADSTNVQAWRLANGLEVRVRDVPGAACVSMTLAYRAGSFLDPPARPGLADLLAEVQFTAPAGDIPERSHAELGGLRPMGWKLVTNDHLSLLTEVATREQFPGVLRQVATRAHGVTVDDSSLARAVAATVRQLADRSFGDPLLVQHQRVRDLARGLADPDLLARASGRSLAGLRPAAVDTLLRTYYAPANAALALAGDFRGLDVRALLEREFGDIPAGAPQPDPPALHAAARRANATLPGLRAPLGALGVHAPPLESEQHPAFFLNAMILGGWWKRQGDASKPATFNYSILDEPELVHFALSLPAATDSAAIVSRSFAAGVEEYAGMAFTEEIPSLFRASVGWLLGGPLPAALRASDALTPGVMSTVSGGAATRALWRGDAFWDRYRQRFETCRFGPTTFRQWLLAPEHQTVLLLRPRP